MQNPPRWCPWISTAKSDLDAHLRERLDEDEDSWCLFGVGSNAFSYETSVTK